jgi:hypothetical protein
MLLRLAMRLGGCSIHQALSLLATVTAHHKHRFSPDVLPCDGIRWHGVIGHRQVTNAYLAAQARSHVGKLASFDAGLVALHPGRCRAAHQVRQASATARLHASI